MTIAAERGEQKWPQILLVLTLTRLRLPSNSHGDGIQRIAYPELVSSAVITTHDVTADGIHLREHKTQHGGRRFGPDALRQGQIVADRLSSHPHRCEGIDEQQQALLRGERGFGVMSQRANRLGLICGAVIPSTAGIAQNPGRAALDRKTLLALGEQFTGSRSLS